MKDATYYDEVYRGEYAVDEKRVQFVAELCRGRVLDVGSGDGALAQALGDGWQDFYVGIDFSREAGKRAQNRAPGFSFIVRDVLGERGLPTPDGPWDTIVLGEMLEHLDDRAETKLLKRVKRALAPDGRLIVTTPNGASVPDPAHVRTFHLNGMAEKLAPFGEVCGHPYSDRYVVASAHRAGRPKLSVCLIVKNEEELLGQCLESLKDVWNELVVVDTGSTDNTVEIAKSFGARIGHFPWIDDFAAARNYAESLCFGQYIYMQDADEVLVEGGEIIREIVEQGKLDGVSPMLVFSRDPETAKPASTFQRQEMLHKHNGTWRWAGAAHNWLRGPCRHEEPRIVVEHLNRPSGDRPNHCDIFQALRANCNDPNAPLERSIFYLARQYFYEKCYHETIAMVTLMLQSPPSWPIQRARACIMAGDSWRAVGNMDLAAQAYLKAIAECPTTAEPFFCLDKLRYDQQRWLEAATWFKASTVAEPGGYFVDRSIYEWRRYDLLAVCLHKLGRFEDARRYGAKALAARPNDERLKRNMEYYEAAT